MPTFESRVFGSHAVDADFFWKGETTVSGCRRERSLHVRVDDQAVLDRAAALVDSIEVLDARARKAIDDARSAPDGDTTVGDFVDDQLAEMDAETLFEVFAAAPSAIAQTTFLGKLELRSVAVRAPDDTPVDGFALVLDYSLPGDVSDQLLVVTFTAAGEPVSVEWES